MASFKHLYIMRIYRKVYLLVIAIIFIVAVIMPWNLNDDVKTIIIHSLFVFVLSFLIRKKGSSLLLQCGKAAIASILLGYINMYNNHSWHTFGLVVLVSIASSLICYGGYMLWQHFRPQINGK